MTNAVLSKQSLPAALLNLIDTDKVHLQEKDGEIRISPLREGSGLLGLSEGLDFSTEKFLAFKRENKEKESRQLGE